MKKIYVNGRFLTQPITGINRFAFELCRSLSLYLDFTIVAPKGQINPCYDTSGLKVIEYGSLKSHLWEQISLPLFLYKEKNYLLINFSGLGPLLIKSKISTIHDISFLFNPKWFSKRYYYLYKYMTPLTIKTSKHLLTVSEFSKSEIIRYYKIDSNRISVIYNAVDFVKNCKNSAPKGYVLTVGSLDPRKNLVSLFNAFQESELSEYTLHVVGSPNKVFGSIEFSRENFPNIHFLGRISDLELIKEYENASLFVSASLYEGFGIPPLEALVLGCNIAVSDIPVYHEIFGESAYYFTPTDPKDMAKVIKCAIQKSNIHLKQEIELITSRYSWSRSAAKLKKIIQNL